MLWIIEVGQNGCNFAEDIFNCKLLNNNYDILVHISLKFVPKGPMDNNSALFQVMFWNPTRRLAIIQTNHYYDIIMGAIASDITGLTSVYLTLRSGTDQRKHQSPTSLAFVRGIHRWPVNSPYKWPVTRKMLSFDDVIMWRINLLCVTQPRRVNEQLMPVDYFFSSRKQLKGSYDQKSGR